MGNITITKKEINQIGIFALSHQVAGLIVKILYNDIKEIFKTIPKDINYEKI